MEKFKLDIKDLYTLYFYTNSNMVRDKILNEVKAITKTIPATVKYLGNVKTIEEQSDYLVYLNGNSKSVEVNKEKNIALLTLCESKLFFPDLVYLMIGMVANNLQKKELYFLQGAVTKYNDQNSILILGDPNAGKTTFAYKLISKYGYSLIANDNVLVGMENGNLKTFCGTKYMQMRLGSLKLYCPEILKEIDATTYARNDRDEWDTKIYIDDFLQKTNTKYCDESIITDIFCVDTLQTNNYYLRQREYVDRVLLVYEHLTKQIRSHRYALTSFKLPLPSFENEKYMNGRYKMSEQIAEKVAIYDAKGDVDSLVKKMRRF